LKCLYYHFEAKLLSVTGFQFKHRAMAPKKASKKNEDQPEGDIISDTTASGVHSVKSWTGISEKLEDELKYAATDSENHLRDISETELHKVAARPRLVSYTDMIGWALEKVDIPTRSILNEKGAVIGSFRPEHIQVMYKLSPNYRHTFNSEFVAEFQRKECIEAGQEDGQEMKTSLGMI
jgi:hypothetical protein